MIFSPDVMMHLAFSPVAMTIPHAILNPPPDAPTAPVPIPVAQTIWPATIWPPQVAMMAAALSRAALLPLHAIIWLMRDVTTEVATT